MLRETEQPTWDDAVTQLQTLLVHIDELPEVRQEIAAYSTVLARYQPLLAHEHLPELTAAEFYSFLLYENNQHWTGLNRQGSRMTADMVTLRAALDLLLYGEADLAARFTEAVGSVTGMGRAIASALLLVVYPERYGVWNSTSEAGLKRLGLWPELNRGLSLGERYVAVNGVLQQLAQALDSDLWTLDALFWKLDSPIVDKLIGHTDHLPTPDQTFGLERHLQAFLWDNWDQTSLGASWERYREAGDDEAGYEYPCDVGRIDLLAKHRTEPRWLVIELKRGQTGDATVGQVLRYMGWVQRHLAQPGESVHGLIIARDPEPGLEYALQMVPKVDFQRYEVRFDLHAVDVHRRETP